MSNQMTQTELNAEFARRRAEYKSFKGTREEVSAAHQSYYLWLAQALGVNDSFLPVPLARLRQSNDPHFNDIPLQRWDARHPVSRRVPLTLSESVCILKAYARHRASQTD